MLEIAAPYSWQFSDPAFSLSVPIFGLLPQLQKREPLGHLPVSVQAEQR